MGVFFSQRIIATKYLAASGYLPLILDAFNKFIDDLRNCPNKLEYIKLRRTQTILALQSSFLSQNELFMPAKETLLEIIRLDETYVKDLSESVKQYYKDDLIVVDLLIDCQFGKCSSLIERANSILKDTTAIHHENHINACKNLVL